ncbi:hypothetical protein [Nonomuraea sp. bgisy101]|uniref:hypothetical protein n=1 Tax=Nonomuraea sp. bgisy101 TaxID=3413784 RepID=UPI003D7054C1
MIDRSERQNHAVIISALMALPLLPQPRKAVGRAAVADLPVAVVPPARAPLDLREPVLRVSAPPGTSLKTHPARAGARARLMRS